MSFLMKILAIFPVMDKSKKYLIFMNWVLWGFFLANNLLLLLPTVHTLYCNHGDLITASYTWMETVAIIEDTALLIHFKFQESRFKVSFFYF